MNGLFIAALVLSLIGIALLAADDTHLAVLFFGLAGCLAFFGFVVDGTVADEQRCLDRGGEVVHYGRAGTGVDCINVPEGN